MLGCVIMAAGNAVRFGANKLEAELDGKPLIRRAFEAVPAGVFDRVAVVTQYPAVAALAREFGFEPVRNDRPGDGLSRTVRLGTQALADAVGQALRPEVRACVLERHGTVTCGRSLEEAYFLTESLERLAKTKTILATVNF